MRNSPATLNHFLYPFSLRLSLYIRPLAVLALAAFAAASTTACDDDDDDTGTDTDAGADTDATGDTDTSDDDDIGENGLTVSDDIARPVIENYVALAFASYDDSLTLTTTLQTAVEAFLATPTEATLDAAKDAWLEAREAYGQTEAFRFYEGPIDNAESGPEGALNAWPLDESYIDYVVTDPDSGIVNNPDDFPTIDASTIASLNEAGGETNVSSGYHAIEFLLWGQDLSADGPGNRPVTDYTTAVNADRRATYLSEVTKLLVSDLTRVRNAWAPDDDDNYRAEFLAEPSSVAVTRILTGAGTLAASELSGERMIVAIENSDQEDEHSCFSDNTHRDIVTNMLAVANVWKGTYTPVAPSTTAVKGPGVKGPGVKDLVAAIDQDLADEQDALVTTALEKANSVPAPFDRAIVDDLDVITDLTETARAIEAAGKNFEALGTALGVTVNTAL